MGSRVSIRLAAVIKDPRIKVTLKSASFDGSSDQGAGQEDSAILTLFEKECVYNQEEPTRAAILIFDLCGDAHDLRLEADFNAWGRREGLQRLLFQYSIPHYVIPG